MRLAKRIKSTLPIVGACFLALGAALGFTGWLSLGICLWSFAPETLMLGDNLAPFGALFVGGWSLRRAGWKVGVLAVAFWLGAWLILLGRFSVLGWWRDGVLGLSWAHFFSWAAAIFAAFAGGVVGARFRSKWAFGAAASLVLAGLWGAQGLGSSAYRDVENGALVFSREQSDGTQIRLLAYDLSAINVGIYDADSDDVRPYDDRNASWLGQAMPLVWCKIERATGGKTGCAVNGGFFGAEFPLVARHEAPLVVGGAARYDSRVLEDDWPAQNCLLGWKREGNRLRFSVVEDAPFVSLARRFDGVLGGVRALIVNAKARELRPGMGGTTLKCSRTSVAWKNGNFYVLSVRDPDGEAASLRADKREKAGERGVQVGGWDAREVQQFWAERRMENAVLFDGGESTQLALPAPNSGVWMSHSSYHFTRTPFYINQKPVRFLLPMLPGFEANGGVLNYFYVAEK